MVLQQGRRAESREQAVWYEDPLGCMGREAVPLLGVYLVEVIQPLSGQKTQRVPLSSLTHQHRNKDRVVNISAGFVL